MRLRSQTTYWAIHRCDRDQIRDQDTKGQRRTGPDGCDVDAMASATNSYGGPDAAARAGPGWAEVVATGGERVTRTWLRGIPAALSSMPTENESFGADAAD